MCDAKGELFIKPCTDSEINFYQSASQQFGEFAELMPLFMGTLTLGDQAHSDNSLGLNIGNIPSILPEPGNSTASQDQTAAPAATEVGEPSEQLQSDRDICQLSKKGKKIKTDKAIVLENATFGFKKANILDVKLGVRLWADDAPLEKRHRFDKISAETTHGCLGFRIAGMRIYRGDETSKLDADGYRHYDKLYGRLCVNRNNVVDEIRRFVYNKHAKIDPEDSRVVSAAFARELHRARDVIARHESRMYSSSLLFVFEGDAEALHAAIEENCSSASTDSKKVTDQSTKRNDSGIGLEVDTGCHGDRDENDDDEATDDDENCSESSLRPICLVKLIDFAHAHWATGQGPDENVLVGVTSLGRIFEELI